MKFRFLYMFWVLFVGLLSKECKREMMESYGLHGIKMASDEPCPVCHTIKKNCCSKEDFLKIFDLVSTSLQPTLVSFYEKMKESMKKLRSLHQTVQQINVRTFSNEHQNLFCQNARDNFKKFAFDEMVENLTLGFEKVMNNFRELHYAFYCVLCDYDAHSNIDLKSKKISLDSTTCMQQLRKNKDYVVTLNIELVDYFESLQHLLDCSFYEKSYEFPFLFEYQENFRENTQNCLDKFDEDSNEMSDQCAAFCNQMNIAGISRHFEGDPSFVEKAIDYYENIIEQIQEQKSKAHSGPETNSEFNPLTHLSQLDNEEGAEERELGGLKLVRRNNNLIRKLNELKIKIPSVKKEIHQNKEPMKKQILHKRKTLEKEQFKREREKQFTNKRKYEEYLHALKRKNRKMRRILEEHAIEKPPGLSEDEMKKYKDIYEDIKILFHPHSDEIYKRTIDPLDLSKFSKVYLYEQGLNILKYLDGLNFEINRNEILKLIHGPKSSEKLDYELIVLLEAVSKDHITVMVEDLKDPFTFELPDDLKDADEEKMASLPPSKNEAIEMIGFDDSGENNSEEGDDDSQGPAESVVSEAQGEKEAESERILENLTEEDNDIEDLLKIAKIGKDFKV
jgi:hypothetical protein